MLLLLFLVQLKQCTDEGTVSLVSYTNKRQCFGSKPTNHIKHE